MNLISHSIVWKINGAEWVIKILFQFYPLVKKTSIGGILNLIQSIFGYFDMFMSNTNIHGCV